MAISANIILDTRYKSKDGYHIKIRVRPKYIPLNEYSEKEHWDGENVTKEHPDYRRLYTKLNKRKLQLLEELQYCNDNNLSVEAAYEVIKNGLEDKETEIFALKQKIKQLQSQSGITFVEFANIRIEEKSKIGESIKPYEEVRNLIKKYGNIPLNDITYEWLSKFVNDKLSGKANRGGVNAYLRSIRAIYKEAQRRESLGIKKDNPFIGIFKASAKKDVIKLNDEDWEKILNFKPESITKQQKDAQMKYMRLFLFQLVIGGHDLVEISLLTFKNLKDGRVKFKRYKNRNKPDGGIEVDNLLLPYALDFIEEYGTGNKGDVFSFIPNYKTERAKYDSFIRAYNRSLKSISNKLELSDILKSKSPRYLFRTQAGNMMIGDVVVSQIQGHKLQGMTFSYQGRIPYGIQDKFHKKIVKAIFKKGGSVI